MGKGGELRLEAPLLELLLTTECELLHAGSAVAQSMHKRFSGSMGGKRQASLDESELDRQRAPHLLLGRHFNQQVLLPEVCAFRLNVDFHCLCDVPPCKHECIIAVLLVSGEGGRAGGELGDDTLSTQML